MKMSIDLNSFHFLLKLKQLQCTTDPKLTYWAYFHSTYLTLHWRTYTVAWPPVISLDLFFLVSKLHISGKVLENPRDIKALFWDLQILRWTSTYCSVRKDMWLVSCHCSRTVQSLKNYNVTLDPWLWLNAERGLECRHSKAGWKVTFLLCVRRCFPVHGEHLLSCPEIFTSDIQQGRQRRNSDAQLTIQGIEIGRDEAICPETPHHIDEWKSGTKTWTVSGTQRT